jgi:c-di-GMP-binding flagellar brake protein YcgR
MTFDSNLPENELNRCTIHSRREIIALLREIGTRNQLMHMQANQDGDSVDTSILHIDESNEFIIINCTSGRLPDEHLLKSDHVSFETTLDNIRMLFSVSCVEKCDHDARAGLRIALPKTLVRLQRREFYRVQTSVASPVKCTFPVWSEKKQTISPVTLTLANISAGGLCVMDEKELGTAEVGMYFQNCRINIPDGPVTAVLQLRDVEEVTLDDGRHVRRLGFMFVELSISVAASLQRYITKLEREQDAHKGNIGKALSCFAGTSLD